MKLIPILALTSAALISGCQSMADMADNAAGLGTIETQESSFDDSKFITLSPDALYHEDAPWTGVSTKLGAVWASTTPEYIFLTLKDESNISSSNSYKLFESLSVKTEDGITELPINGTTFTDDGYNSVTKTIHTQSTSTVRLKLADLESYLNSETCVFKITRSDGYELADCKVDRIPGGKKTAILGLKKVLNEINL